MTDGHVQVPSSRTMGGRALRHHVLPAQSPVESDCAADVTSNVVPGVHVAKLAVHVAFAGFWRTYAAPVRGPHVATQRVIRWAGPVKGTGLQGTGGTMCGFTGGGAIAGFAAAGVPVGGPGLEAIAAGATAVAEFAGALAPLACCSCRCISSCLSINDSFDVLFSHRLEPKR